MSERMISKSNLEKILRELHADFLEDFKKHVGYEALQLGAWMKMHAIQRAAIRLGLPDLDAEMQTAMEEADRVNDLAKAETEE